MTEDFVTYEQAKKLKGLGFDWETCAFYLGTALNTKVPSWEIINTTNLPIIYAPTLSQVQKWLRNIHGISVEIISTVAGKCWMYQLYHTTKDDFGLPIVIDRKNVKGTGYETYETALSSGIDKALELLTNKTERNERS